MAHSPTAAIVRLGGVGVNVAGERLVAGAGIEPATHGL